MKRLSFVVAAALLFAVAPLSERFGPIVSSVALVWLGILLAMFASGTVNALAVAAGAVGALGSGVLVSVSPAAAGAVLVAAAFAERTTRIRARNGKAVHVGLALVSGAVAGSLATAFSGASVTVFGVAVAVAAVLVALPLLVEADDPVAHALDQAANFVAEPARRALRDGAELRRNAEEVPLDRATQARVRSTWLSLVRLAEARVRLERTRPERLVRVAEPASSPPPSSPEGEAPSSAPEPELAKKSAADAVLDMLDQRIAEHVAVLSRAFTAVDTAHAAALGLDDAALAPVAELGDSLEEVSRAMVEVK